MILDAEQLEAPVKPRLYIAKPDRTVVAEIAEYSQLRRSIKLGAIPSLDFQIPYQVSRLNRLQANPHIPYIKNRYLIRFVQGETEEWYMIKSPSDVMEESEDYKSVEALGLAVELNDKSIRNYSAVSVTASQALQTALAETIWGIGSVDASFDLLYRSFDVADSNALDFVLEIAETFNALVIFDSVRRNVHFYDLDQYGTNKGLEVSYGNLLKSAKVTENIDEFCTRLKGFGAEGIGIVGQNPTGQNFIEDYSFFMYPFERDANGHVLSHSDYMSDALCHALLDYGEVLSTASGTYQSYQAQLSDCQTALTAAQTTLGDLQNELAILEDQLSVANANQESTADLISAKTAKSTQIEARKAAVVEAQDQLDAVNAHILQLQNQLAVENHFSPELLVEWNPYIIVAAFENTNVADPKQLLDLMTAEFEKRKQPKLVAEIGMANLLEIATERARWRTLNLGDAIAIKNSKLGVDIQAKMIEMSFDYESGDVTVTISNVKEMLNDKVRFLKDLYRNNMTSSNVISNNYKWNQAATDVNEVQSVLDGAWDAAKRSIAASSNESVTIGRKGIITTSLDDPDKYVVIQHGQVALTKDGGNSWKTAITPDGVYGERLVGQIVASSTLNVANSAGTFRVDGNGVVISGSSLTITGGLPDDQIEGAGTWNSAATNFNDRNDRIATIPANPAIASNGTAVDHTINTDGSANISFEWSFNGSGNAGNIDGFIVYAHQSTSGSAYTFGADVANETVYYVSQEKRAFIFYGAPADKYYTFGVRAYRYVDNDIAISGILQSAIMKSAYSGENPYRPSANVAFNGDITGTIDGLSASTIRTAAQNFDTRNDRNGTTPANPTVTTSGTAIDHTINTDGSADISFEWTYNGAGSAYDIDGFVVYIYQSTSSSAYTFGSNQANEQVYYVTPDKRALLIYGVPSNKYYTFGVQAYRSVDQDVNSNGILKSGIVKSTASGENPFRPSSSVAFSGDITGTISGTSASTVASTALNSVQKGTAYNGVVVDTTNGLRVTRSNNRFRTTVNATVGITMESSTNGSTWTPALSADTNGNLSLLGKFSTGTGASAFHADTNGIYLGSTSFGSAPFRVTPAGALTASKVSLTGGTMGWGNFSVSSSGVITATGANISGNVTASSVIAGISINSPTITGGLIQTNANGVYPHAVMSASSNLFGVYKDSSHYITMIANDSQSLSPALVFINGSARASFDLGIGTDGTGVLNVNSFGDVNFSNSSSTVLVQGTLNVTKAINLGGFPVATRDWVINNAQITARFG